MDVNIHPMRPEDTDGKGFVHWKSWQETYTGRKHLSPVRRWKNVRRMPAAGRKTPSSSG